MDQYTFKCSGVTECKCLGNLLLLSCWYTLVMCYSNFCYQNEVLALKKEHSWVPMCLVTNMGERILQGVNFFVEVL